MPEKSIALGLVIGATVGASVGRAFGTVKQQSRGLGQSLKKARLGATLTGDIIKYKNQLTKLKAEQAKTGAGSEKLGRKIAEAERKFKKAALRANKYGIEVGNAARQHRLFQRSVERSEKAMAKLERRQRNKEVRGSLKGQALGLLGGAYAIGRQFTSALDFESASVRLKTVLNTQKEKIGQALIDARNHAIAFARRGLTSESDVLGIQYALSSAGFDAAAARAGSTVVAKVATVTKGAPEQVGEVVATVFNNLGDSLVGNTQQKLERIGDLLTKTQFKFQIRDFGQLGESLKYATPTLSQFNMDLAQGVTIIGAMNSAGLQGSQAGTAFAATMRNMSKASEELGFELVRNEKGQLDFISTMESMSDAIGGFDNMDQETIDELQKLFGEEGIRGVALLGKQLHKLRAAQNDVTNSSKGLVDSSYNEFVKSAPGQLRIFTNNVRLLGMTFAGSLLPALNQILKPMIGFTQEVGKVIQNNPVLAKTLFGVVTGLVAVKAAAIALKFVMATSPIGLIVTGLVIGAGAVVANWEKVKTWFSKFADWIGSVWKKISTPFKTVSKYLGSTVSGWFDDKASGAGKTAGAAAMAAGLAVSPVGAGNNTTVQVNAPITVNAAPGMSEQQVASQVAQKLTAATDFDGGDI